LSSAKFTCTNANPAPIWEEQSGSVVVTFRPAPGFSGEATAQVTAQDTAQVTEEVTRLLPLRRTPQSRDDLMRQLGLSHREHFRKAYLLPVLEASLLERTISEKPQSSKQRYRLTAKGHEWLRQKGRP
jgi:ATP-dependent DNA helicase RecG